MGRLVVERPDRPRPPPPPQRDHPPDETPARAPFRRCVARRRPLPFPCGGGSPPSSPWILHELGFTGTGVDYPSFSLHLVAAATSLHQAPATSARTNSHEPAAAARRGPCSWISHLPRLQTVEWFSTNRIFPSLSIVSFIIIDQFAIGKGGRLQEDGRVVLNAALQGGTAPELGRITNSCWDTCIRSPILYCVVCPCQQALPGRHG